MDDNIGVDDPLAYWRTAGKKKINKDPYAPGIVHGGQHMKDVSRALTTLIHRGKYRKVTVEVAIEADDYHITFNVKSRK